MSIVQRGGTPTHRILTPIWDGDQFAAGELVRYSGAPNWKFEPLDAEERAQWQKNTADPKRVEHQNWIRGGRLGVRSDARKLGV